MTLIELTVVILVLLSLISILFIGAKAWKVGSDRAANVMNLRNVQQAVRGHAAMNDIPQADATVTPPSSADAVPKTPSSELPMRRSRRLPAVARTVATVSYTTPMEINTAVGVLWLVPSTTGAVGATYGPKTGSTADW